jgi:hypothetical protein
VFDLEINIYENSVNKYIPMYCSGYKNNQGDRKSGIFDESCYCRVVRFGSGRTWEPLAFDDCKDELGTERLVGIEISILLYSN